MLHTLELQIGIKTPQSIERSSKQTVQSKNKIVRCKRSDWYQQTGREES